MNSCICGNERPFEACCQRFLSGQAWPQTAEELMRSRFSAYATGAIDYVVETEVDADRQIIENWAAGTRFTRLRVLECRAGGPEDQQGTVTFEADFENSSTGRGTHRETSSFERRDGRWYFVSGKHNPARSGESRVGRNDPCPCGSGKKYKKCCLA